jgi:hypothetical protein
MITITPANGPLKSTATQAGWEKMGEFPSKVVEEKR